MEQQPAEETVPSQELLTQSWCKYRSLVTNLCDGCLTQGLSSESFP